MSCESWHDDLPLPAPRQPPWSAERLESEIGVYRAQTQARAVENRVWVVKSNVAACRTDPLQGSHGMSAVIDPYGRIVAEAGMATEEMLTFSIDIADADALYARKSLLPEYALSGWWADGLAQLDIQHHHVSHADDPP